MRAPRSKRYRPHEPWRLFRDLRTRPGPRAPLATINGRIGRGQLNRVRAELARTRKA
jgi:hypothetical protein